SAPRRTRPEWRNIGWSQNESKQSHFRSMPLNNGNWLLIFVAGLLLSLVFLPRLSGQDSANVIPFQGQLANQAGQPLSPSSAVTLVFRLYQTPVGDVAIWEESQPNVSVNGGRFSVLL